MKVDKIHKVKITAGFIHGYKGHELEVWCDDMDLNKRGYIILPCLDHLKDKGIVKKGYSFKASEEYYNTEAGKGWIVNYINSRYKSE